MIRIGNGKIEAGIVSKGAELQSLVHQDTGLQYMWKGDPAVWGKFSPILFPVIGTLKNDQYTYDQKEYRLPRHGFARDKEFVVEEHSASKAVFRLQNDADTLSKYPFEFELRLIYEVTGEQLQVTYSVKNTGHRPLFFSVGGHPAFAVPLVQGTGYDDYYLEFDSIENTSRWPISPEGLIEKTPIPLLQHTAVLPLTKALFEKDALVFKSMSSSKVSLKSKQTPHGWSFDFSQFPFLGIWAAKGGDFVCVEPWCGIADSVDHNGDFKTKEGILQLESRSVIDRTWSIQLW